MTRRKTLQGRRRFLLAAGKGAAAVCAVAALSPRVPQVFSESAGAQAFELDEITIAGLQDAMKAGRHTARSITELYLARIEAIDKGGPALNSVIEVNPDALAIADALDRERREGRTRGPLHGVPILLKDNIDTADKMQTTAGSLALAGVPAPRDAFIVERLRTAGAVILGKTNLSEWANFRSSKSTSGWSGRGGLTKNPYALDRNACGSSSGSGVAVAANLCAAAVGTETDGSIVCPSTTNGIVGIKPTLGLVSRSGIIPIAHSQDTAGPMARTVADAAILLGALVGVDARDAATNASRGHALGDYTPFLDANGLSGMRVGVVRKGVGTGERVDKLMADAIAVIKRLGAVVVDPADIPTTGKFDDSEQEVLLYEFKADLNAYLATRGPNAPVKSLKEIIEFNEKNRDRELQHFGQDLMLKAEAKGPLTDAAYKKALESNRKLSGKLGIDAVMTRHRLDVLIAPTGGPAWLTDLVNGDHYTGGYSSASAVAGYPHVTVPGGFVHGLPVGVSFFGRAWSEPTLIKAAYAFEQATKLRRAPQFLPRVEIK